MVCAGRVGTYTLFLKNWEYCFGVKSITFASEIKKKSLALFIGLVFYYEGKVAEILLLFSFLINF